MTNYMCVITQLVFFRRAFKIISILKSFFKNEHENQAQENMNSVIEVTEIWVSLCDKLDLKIIPHSGISH